MLPRRQVHIYAVESYPLFSDYFYEVEARLSASLFFKKIKTYELYEVSLVILTALSLK